MLDVPVPCGELMRTPSVALLASLLFVLTLPAAAAAQTRFDAGVHVSFLNSGEFDASTTGVGGRVAWYPSSWLGAEAEVTFYPADFPDGRAFTSSQREGLFGVTIGPRLGWVRPFARVRPGFVTLAGAPAPFPCILIFPPPIACQLAGGATLAAFDLGGGVQFGSSRAFLRVDVGDRMVRYTGPVIDEQREVRRDAFWGHDSRVAVGAGIVF
jgi:hypothetical protein